MTDRLITITSRSGANRRFRSGIDPTRIVGLDESGRVVVNDFDAFVEGTKPHRMIGGYPSAPFLFGLTLCCNASDKGCEDGVYCRACYGDKPNADEGNYLFQFGGPEQPFIGFDPAVTITVDGEPIEVPEPPAWAVPEAGSATSDRPFPTSYDIEATVSRHAQTLGLDPANHTAALALGPAEDIVDAEVVEES